MLTTPTNLPAYDASNFTVSSIEGAREMENEAQETKKRERKKEESSEKIREKMVSQMMKPPPVAVIKENMRQQEKIKQENEEVEKAKIFTKIRLYYERFPLLIDKLPKISPRASLAEVKVYLKMIYDTLDSVGSVKNLYSYVDLGMAKLEEFMTNPHNLKKIPTTFQLDLRGLSTLFRQGKFPEVEPIIAQLDIEYPWLGRRGLFARTLSTLAGIAYKVHLYNSGDPVMKKILDMGNAPPVDVPVEPPE